MAKATYNCQRDGWTPLNYRNITISDDGDGGYQRTGRYGSYQRLRTNTRVFSNAIFTR